MIQTAQHSWELGPFIKSDEHNPCLLPSAEASFACPIRGETVRWEEKDVFNPAAVVRGGRIFLLYRAEDRVGKHAGTSRIGIAESKDGLTFLKNPKPVLYPDHDQSESLEWEGGCEDPRIVEDEHGTYYMAYTAYDGSKARLCIATSRDLIHWTKHGLAFGQALGGKYSEIWCKSGSIVTRLEEDRFIAVRINGCYWMYWGESNIYTAYSEDLIHWTPSESMSFHELADYSAMSSLTPVLTIRRNRFDSFLVEPGPQAVLTDDGIVLIYNGRNHPEYGDPAYAPNAYCGAQALFDSRDPTALIARSSTPFIVPDKEYETNGQFNHVCFLEGLVHFQGRWLLYYGTADSRIAVACCSRNRKA